MRELALVGFVCVAFGLGAYRGSGEVGGFGAVNLGLGFASLLAAAVLYARRWGRDSAPAERGPLQDGALLVLALLWGAVLVERAAATSQVRFDWTFEGRYELASATVKALTDLPCSLRATLYHDEHDPRTRRTRLLLEELARHADVDVRQRVLDEAPKEEDFFGIASSNAVVFECGDRWQRVDRATEGAIFEAVAYLAVRETRVVYATTGAGEGDVESGDPLGFSGLATALETEGYVVRRLDSPAISEIPDDAAAVLVIAPERQLHPSALAALRDYLEHGGSLIAMIEPGFESGLETVLAEFGLRSPNAVVIDPASGSIEGEAPGLNPIVYRYASHPVTRGLEANRRTFFRGARSFELRKPRPDDEIRGVAYTSGDSWLHPDTSILGRRTPPERPPDARTDFQPLAVTGRYERSGTETRIVAFGDSDFASNRSLRSLYNLDLAMNAAHWSMRRESQISLRPKAGQLIQFPIPIQNSLKAFYGVGLLVPQILLLVGGLVWLRRRTA